VKTIATWTQKVGAASMRIELAETEPAGEYEVRSVSTIRIADTALAHRSYAEGIEQGAATLAQFRAKVGT
jgi:hypothetical protein